jgi:3-oxoacyl-[acyl-carrier protein] reductase
MSKAGVVALTRTLAIELGRSGIRVNAVAPGFVEGGMTARHVRDTEGRIDVEAYEKILEQGRRRNPLGITGKPEDIAQAFLYLASDAARYMTGQVLHANGGAYMP